MSDSQEPNSPVTEPSLPPSKYSAEMLIERATDYYDTLRLWVTKSWRIALMMGKGAYLTSERRRLYQRLGEDVFFRVQRGELRDTDLELRVKDLERLTRKLELEDAQIRAVRFGKIPTKTES